jgi:phosphoribosylamine---glycine ligase
MKVLIVDDAGEGSLDLALRAQRDGHKVKLFQRRYDPQKRPVGKGLVELVNAWQPHVDWADLVILPTCSVYMHQMDRLHAMGATIIGGNLESASWELDRLTGMQVFKKAGIAVPPYREFRDYPEAIKYVEKQGCGFASKPCWDEPDKGMTYVGKEPEDMIYMLDKWRRKHGRPKGTFILQEVVKGIEFAVGSWWGPGGWSGGWEENKEFKKHMAGDVGGNTGEMGTVIRYVKSSKLADKMLKPLEAQLERIGYVGCIDVNCIIDEDGNPWPLEFTNRFGWPAWNISQALLKDDPIEFMLSLAEGKTTNPFRLNEIAVGVVVAQGDFPFSKIAREDVCGIPIWGAGEADERFHPCEIQKGKETEWATAGDYLMVCTGTGDTVQQARQAAYRAVHRLSIPNNPFWRVDIGSKLARELPELNRHGYARGMVYSGS